MRSGILAMIAEYDLERESYIKDLEEEVTRLQKEKSDLINEIGKGVQIRERSMLQLILSGALKKPETDPSAY